MKMLCSQRLGIKLLIGLIGITLLSLIVGKTSQAHPLRQDPPVLLLEAVSLLDEPEPCDRQLPYGARVSDTIQQNRAECRYMFSGRAGDVISIHMTQADQSLDPQIDLLDPAGRLVTSNDDASDAPNSLIYAHRLPQTGLYTIVAHAYEQQSTGGFTLVLAPQRCNGELGNKVVVFGETSTDNPQCVYTFAAPANTSLFVNFHKLDSGAIPPLVLLGPDGNVVPTDPEGLADYYLLSQGVYTLIVRPSSDQEFGPFELSFSMGVDHLYVATTCGDAIAYNLPLTGDIFLAGWSCEYRFIGKRNDVVTIRMRRLDATLSPNFQLIAPNGEIEATADASSSANVQIVRAHRLAANGQYTIVAGAYRGESSGRYSLSLTSGAFAVDETVRNAYSVPNDPVNLRLTPGYRSKPAGDVLTQMPGGVSLTILGGPKKVDSLTWWPVRFTTPGNQTYTGWVAERTNSGQTILAPAQ